MQKNHHISNHPVGNTPNPGNENFDPRMVNTLNGAPAKKSDRKRANHPQCWRPVPKRVMHRRSLPVPPASRLGFPIPGGMSQHPRHGMTPRGPVPGLRARMTQHSLPGVPRRTLQGINHSNSGTLLEHFIQTRYPFGYDASITTKNNFTKPRKDAYQNSRMASSTPALPSMSPSSTTPLTTSKHPPGIPPPPPPPKRRKKSNVTRAKRRCPQVARGGRWPKERRLAPPQHRVSMHLPVHSAVQNNTAVAKVLPPPPPSRLPPHKTTARQAPTPARAHVFASGSDHSLRHNTKPTATRQPGSHEYLTHDLHALSNQVRETPCIEQLPNVKAQGGNTSEAQDAGADVCPEKPRPEMIDSGSGKPRSEIIDSSSGKPRCQEVDSSNAKPRSEVIDSSSGKPRCQEVDSSFDKPHTEEADASSEKPAEKVDTSSEKPPEDVDETSEKQCSKEPDVNAQKLHPEEVDVNSQKQHSEEGDLSSIAQSNTGREPSPASERVHTTRSVISGEPRTGKYSKKRKRWAGERGNSPEALELGCLAAVQILLKLAKRVELPRTESPPSRRKSRRKSRHERKHSRKRSRKHSRSRKQKNSKKRNAVSKICSRAPNMSLLPRNVAGAVRMKGGYVYAWDNFRKFFRSVRYRRQNDRKRRTSCIAYNYSSANGLTRRSPVPLYCFCQQPHDECFWIGCDEQGPGCKDWYHPECLWPRRTEKFFDNISYWVCPICR